MTHIFWAALDGDDNDPEQEQGGSGPA
jgi:hypothetical protein